MNYIYVNILSVTSVIKLIGFNGSHAMTGNHGTAYFTISTTPIGLTSFTGILAEIFSGVL